MEDVCGWNYPVWGRCWPLRPAGTSLCLGAACDNWARLRGPLGIDGGPPGCDAVVAAVSEDWGERSALPFWDRIGG
ncbi:hypothetical protein NDU88_000356 [Pleurodeles waltl]|uniref:Uncharacterized protein n=1 Tax=Pleurodeles waltl TaxID=8319 RepID=A0AAV7URF1_PLEWA|nr:hypothetical protein NDU88_000356 [Pleurodeles waltl]